MSSTVNLFLLILPSKYHSVELLNDIMHIFKRVRRAHHKGTGLRVIVSKDEEGSGVTRRIKRKGHLEFRWPAKDKVKDKETRERHWVGLQIISPAISNSAGTWNLFIERHICLRSAYSKNMIYRWDSFHNLEVNYGHFLNILFPSEGELINSPWGGPNLRNPLRDIPGLSHQAMSLGIVIVQLQGTFSSIEAWQATLLLQLLWVFNNGVLGH